MTNELVLLGLSTLASEDLACVAAGALVADGQLSFTSATLACFTGIYAGDLGLFFAGRLAAGPLARWKWAARRLNDERVRRAVRWLNGNTGRAVFLSRFLPGMRLPTYLAAGVLRTRALRFAFWFGLASAVWTPALVGATAVFGRGAGGSVGTVSAVAAGAVIGLRVVLPHLLQWERRRRLLGLLRKFTRWEFWPSWAAYLPLLPALAWLALRHRSATVFTAANPGMDMSGLLDESKSEILSRLDGSGAVARWTVVRSQGDRVERAVEFMQCNALAYPVVCKPDVGERGRGVRIVRSDSDLRDALAQTTQDTIVQEYVPGAEFGVFYYRLPGEARGHILSITEKQFPTVSGNGVRTVRELILADDRAVVIADSYLKQLGPLADSVPARGERVPIIDIGSHCRGSVFVNGARLATEALRSELDRIAGTFEGFCFGRFDVRAESAQALSAGRFRILELNGVSSESTHVYDPAVSLTQAYRAWYQQWEIAFQIGAANREAGHQSASVWEILRRVWRRLR